MVDYKVTFKGDLGNLAQFDAAIRNSVTASARAIEQANKTLLGGIGNVQGLFNPQTSGPGLFYKQLRTEIDATNRTFIQSGQVVRRAVTDYELALNKAKGTYSLQPIHTDLYDSAPYKKAVGDLDAYEAALKKVAPTEQKILSDREKTLSRVIPLEERLIKLGEQRAVGAKERERIVAGNQVAQFPIQENIARVKTAIAGVDPSDTAAVKELRTQLRQLQQQLRETKAQGADLLKPLDAALAQTDAKIASTQAKIDRLLSSQAQRAQVLRSYNSGYGDLTAAANAVPPIQKDLATVLNQSKELRQNLLKAGLGGGQAYGSQEFQKALADQEASISRYTKNLRTNVTTVQGAFRDLNSGLLQQFTVDLDKNGQVVGRWGGQLAGAGSFLRQTVRDFQKVIEWTVATTVVFGSLAAVVKQLGSINDLNTSLTRLSITAQTSAQETHDLFTDLGQVAIQTATPLNQLVKAADDIALATKQAGDSTDEWKGKIIDLTRAVGIFTNLTGTDTVQATDQLSAAFKQLGVAPADLVGILSKVTAVAGGQSLAINDIVKGLSGLAEAAKAAGLSIDEQIASIQVLSQVTNKTSDEVATSFKNLFGAVSSVGSEKILKSFGIEIRDASGGLRGFLDIYRDIRKALDAGIIPQNRLPDVLRGIAGGPRRAPDAAALLANLGRIDEVVGKSVGATNEALVANAKILDTNAAKVTQFQNAINIAVYEKFGAAIKDLTEALVGVGTVGANLFAGIPTEVISLTVKLGALLIVIKTLGGVAKLTGISGALGELARGFRVAGTEAEASAVKMASASNAAQGIGTANILSRFSKNKLALGALGIAGAGAAIGAAGGGGLDTNTIGSLTQLGGSIALLIPGLQAVGVGLIAGGTLLQLFAGDSTKAAKSTEDLNKDILTLTDSLKENQTKANDFAKVQSVASAKIDELSAKTKKTANDQALLNSATDAYVEATLGLASANQTVSKTFDEILDKLPGLSKAYKDFRGLTREQLNSPEIQKLRNQLVQDLLKATGQNIFTGTPLQASQTYTTNTGTSTIAQLKATKRYPGENTLVDSYSQGPGLDLTDLLKNPALLKSIFNVNNGQGTTFDIPQNQVALGYLQGALAEISTDLQKYGVSDEQFANLTKAITDLAGNVGTSAQNAAIVQQTGAAVQANQLLGIFTGAQAENAAFDVKILDAIQKAQTSAPPPPTRELPGGGVGVIDTSSVDALNKLQKAFADIQAAALAGLAPTNQQLIQIAENTFKVQKATEGTGSLYDQLKDKGDEALNKGILNYLTSIGVSEEQLTSLTEQFGLSLKDVGKIAEDLSATFDKARSSAASSYASRALQLQISKNAGDFEKNAKGLKILTDQNNQALASNNALIDSIEKLSTNAMVDLNQALSQVVGLQGQYFTQTELNTGTTEDFSARVLDTTNKLIENAVAAGVNADGIRKLQDEVAKLIAIITAIPTYKQVVVEIQTKLTGSASAGGGYPAGGFNAIQQELDEAKANDAANTKAQKDAIKELQNMLNKLLGTGKGSSLGKPSGGSGSRSAASKPGPDVSQLDLPDEIANAANRSALIQEAIKRARALQKTIPGADKEASNDIVSLLKGTQNILNVRGVKDDLLRRALEELADVEKKRLEFETKADTIRRIRIGAGSFAGIANVPLNTRTGVSLGSPQGPINVTLNVNGQILTPAQLQQLADLIGSSLARQIAK